MHFEFSTAGKIIFGSGSLNTVGDLAINLGKNALIISGGSIQNTDRIVQLLKKNKINSSLVLVEHEPTIDSIRSLVDFAKQAYVELIIGIGGGSTIDSAKATAAMLANPGDITDYLEVVGLNKPILNPSIPLIAIPTTSGTGSEVTKNAVLGSPHHHLKVSMRSAYMLPRIALIDPELTLSLPPLVTATTGLDALTQLIEPYTCSSPTPITDSLCLDGIKRISDSIFQAYTHGGDLGARESMAISSLYGGLTLANARLGAVHGLAAPIGGLIPAPHGSVCARLLPYVMETNLQAMKERAPAHPSIQRYEV